MATFTLDDGRYQRRIALRRLLLLLVLGGALVSACNAGGGSAPFGSYDEDEFRTLSHREKFDALKRLIAEGYPDSFAGSENLPGGLARSVVWMKGDVPSELTKEFEQYEPEITIQGGARFSITEMEQRLQSAHRAFVDVDYEVYTMGRRRQTLFATVPEDRPIPPDLMAHVRDYMEADLGPVVGELLEGDLVIETGGGPLIPQNGDRAE